MTPAATQRRPDRDRFAAGGTNHMTDFDYGLAGRRTAWQSRRRRLMSPIPSSARGSAQTISASPLPGTSGLAGSRSATANSTPRAHMRRSNTPRFDATKRCRPVSIGAEKQPVVRPALHRSGPSRRVQGRPSAARRSIGLSIRRVFSRPTLTPSRIDLWVCGETAELPLHCSDADEVVCDVVLTAALASEHTKPPLRKGVG